MKSEEILRLVDTIHRSKEIEKEVVFQGIEAALLSAVRKKLGETETATVIIDRETGETTVTEDGKQIDAEDLGRLAAMSGKQVLFQKIREAERDRIFEEYEDKIGQLVSGVVQRYEGPNLIVSLGRVEGFLPRSEQAPGERFRVGERIKALVKDLQKSTNRVKITLSRTDKELVSQLFALEIPEVQDNVIEIKEIAREAGYRTKIAVTTYDTNVDCVGACVGVRGSRIKNIVDELFGEKIDIVRWNESIEVLIIQALKPAEISSMDLDYDEQKAQIYVKPDQQSLAIGKRGQNVRLASKLTEWELEIKPITDEELEQMRKEDPDDIPDSLAEGEEAAEGEAPESEEAASETEAGEAAEEEAAEPVAEEAAEEEAAEPEAEEAAEEEAAEPEAEEAAEEEAAEPEAEEAAEEEAAEPEAEEAAEEEAAEPEAEEAAEEEAAEPEAEEA
ncbi:MAG: transcription termination factor NusA, partial [Planctomycetota bacterium]|nr:transcription termination factor NusA [Planctomycetota bacterium]